jgi:TolB-like protein
MHRFRKHVVILLASILAAASLAAQAPDEAVILAVMPFRSIGDSAALNLGSSFSETLTTKLVGLRGLKVYERSQFEKVTGELALQRESADLFDQETLAKAGSVVSMDFMVVGSVTLAGQRLSCQLRLVRVKDGQALLSRQFEGVYPAAIFELQDSMALEVADALQLKLGELDKRRIARRPTKSLDAWALYNKALGNMARRDRIALLEKALAGDPSFLQAAHLLSDLYLENGESERARSMYELVLSQDPADYRALYNSALLRFDGGDLPRARSAMAQCRDLKPGDPDVLYHLGLFSEFGEAGVRLGPGSDLRTARDFYRQALEIDPLHRESLMGAGMFDLLLAEDAGEPERQLELLESAERSLSKYLELSPAAEEAAELESALGQVRSLIPQLRDYLSKRN